MLPVGNYLAVVFSYLVIAAPSLAADLAPLPNIPQQTIAQNLQRQADSLLTSGNQKFRNRDYPGALTDYSEAIKLSPKFEKAFYNRGDRKSTRLNSSHVSQSRMPSSA